MNRKRHVLSSIILGLIFFSSCGETKIVMKNNVPAIIYVNGEEKGTGEAYIKRFGFNKTVRIKVVYSGYTLSEAVVDREYDLKLLIPTFISCGFFPTIPLSIVAIFYQRKLPRRIELDPPLVSPWDQPYNSFWNLKKNNLNF